MKIKRCFAFLLFFSFLFSPIMASAEVSITYPCDFNYFGVVLSGCGVQIVGLDAGLLNYRLTAELPSGQIVLPTQSAENSNVGFVTYSFGGVELTGAVFTFSTGYAGADAPYNLVTHSFGYGSNGFNPPVINPVDSMFASTTLLGLNTNLLALLLAFVGIGLLFLAYRYISRILRWNAMIERRNKDMGSDGWKYGKRGFWN
ncbi:MAG: hypothetical protein HZB31_06075 [Nitrospirae bacterium]|nr:hypothetical protein [Nitrospirota bacterium]